MTKRLFLFAGYDANGIIDDALIHYVRSMSEYGDVILCMDCDCPKSELKRAAPYVLYAMAMRHGEYDFGSYKRAYMYARDAGILKNYDFVYMINDSVYGPLMDVGPTLTRMENLNTDAFGIAYNPSHSGPHIQSWFVGMRKSVFMSLWYDEFMCSVSHQSDKGLITYMYEQGFTRLLNAHNASWGYLYRTRGRSVYNNVAALFRRGMPFMKKCAFPRYFGGLGNRILYILDHISPDVRRAIMDSARRTYGTDVVAHTLTRNPIRITYRRMKHVLRKILIEGI